MKKLLSLILIIAIMLPFGCISYAESTFTDEVELQYEVLKILKIVNLREAGTYTGAYSDSDMFKNLSKSAFINYICNIYADYGFTETYNAEAIKIAEDNGIIHKNQSDLNKPLNYNEAITMLVRVLGYGDYAEEIGGFPTGYITVANRIGLGNGNVVSGEATLKEYDAITLLYNAINCPVVDIAKITSDEGVVYGGTSDKTLLDRNRNIYRIEGIVECTETSALAEGYSVREGHVKIKGYDYASDVDYRDYIGLNVEAYVREKKSGEDELVAVIPMHNEEITIQSKDIINVSENIREIIYYGENDKEKKVTVPPVVSVIYNGLPTYDYVSADFMPKDGSIRLINNDGKTGYDVIQITDFKTVVVENCMSEAGKVSNAYTYDAENIVVDMKAEAFDVIKIIGTDGTMRIGELRPGDVLKVASARNSEKKVVVAYRSDVKISGNVTSVWQGDDGKVVLNDTEYALSNEYKEALKANDAKAREIKPGQNYVLYLDYFGEIVYVQEDGNLKYAIPVATAEVSNGLESTYKVKLYTTDGQWQIIELDEKIEWVSEGTKKNDDEAIALIPVAQGEDVSLIGYTLSGDGKLKSVSIPQVYDGEGNNGDFNVINEFTAAYKPTNKTFAPQIFLKDQTKVICVDKTNTSDEKSYSVLAPSALFELNYTIEAYNIDEFGLTDIIIVANDNTLKNRNLMGSDVFVVRDVAESLDKDGYEITEVQCAMGQYEMISFTCDDPTLAEGLRRGDVIVVEYSKEDGTAKQIKKYRSASEFDKFESPGNMNVLFAMLHGSVDKIDTVKGMMRVDCGSDKYSVRIADTTNVIVYDSKINEVYLATPDNIEPEDRVSVRSQWSKGMTVIIYR